MRLFSASNNEINNLNSFTSSISFWFSCLLWTWHVVLIFVWVCFLPWWLPTFYVYVFSCWFIRQAGLMTFLLIRSNAYGDLKFRQSIPCAERAPIFLVHFNLNYSSDVLKPRDIAGISIIRTGWLEWSYWGNHRHHHHLLLLLPERAGEMHLCVVVWGWWVMMCHLGFLRNIHMALIDLFYFSLSYFHSR